MGMCCRFEVFSGRHHVFLLTRGTIANETNQCFGAAYSCDSTCFPPSRLQRTKSFVRECPPVAGHRVPFSQHDHVRSGATGFCSHCEWQSVCFGFGRGHQRGAANQPDPGQYTIENDAHYGRNLRSRNCKRDSQHPSRKLGKFGLHERRDQQGPCLDRHLGDITASASSTPSWKHQKS